MNNGDRPSPEAAQGLRARSVTASFTADDLDRSVRFYTEGLGFEVEERHEEAGQPVFVALQAGEARLGIGQDDFAKGRNRLKGVGMRIWITTDQDLHVLADRVTAAGYTLAEKVGPLPWGPLAFAVVDPDGFALTITNGT